MEGMADTGAATEAGTGAGTTDPAFRRAPRARKQRPWPSLLCRSYLALAFEPAVGRALAKMSPAGA